MNSKWLVGVLVVLMICSATVWADELSVTFDFSKDGIVLTEQGGYTRISFPDSSLSGNTAGAPAIPSQYANILLPSGAENISVSASGEWELLAGDIVPNPYQPPQPKSRARRAFVEADDSQYAQSAPWPAEIATYQGDHDMQGYQFVSVRVNPLAYVGSEKALYLRPTVTVTVQYDLPENAARTVLAKHKNKFEPLVNSLVVNPTSSAQFAPKAQEMSARAGAVDYLIITSATLSNSFQRLADYRATAIGGGYTTRVLTTNYIGSTFSGTDIQAKIRACISNAVATLGTEMVVLGGDDTIVPDRDCYVTAEGDTESQMPTDLYYSSLTGSWNNDGDGNYGETSDGVNLAWNVIVGRIPMRTTTQVDNYVTKVTTYEAGVPVHDKIILGGPAAWWTYTGTGRPSDDVTGDGHAGFRSTSPAHNSVSDSEMWLRRLYRDGIKSYWPAEVGLMCDTITSWDSSACGDHVENASNTLAAFNRNWTHLMFSGHGAPQEWGLESGDFTQANASSMTGMTAFVYTDACLTGHFDKNSNSIDGYSYTTEPCLGEGFLRNSRANGGALAHMGCARYGWGEPDPYYETNFPVASNTSDGGPSTVYAYKFYKRMYEKDGRTLGEAFAMHKADMISSSGANGCERWIQFGMNLLGDPALKMPTGVALADQPPTITVVGETSAYYGDTVSLSVSASDIDGDTITLAASGLPSGANFNASTGAFSWQANALGNRTVTFTATDKDGTTTKEVVIAVALKAPVANDPPAGIDTTSFTAGWTAVSGAQSYVLNVAEGSAGGDVILTEDFSKVTVSNSTAISNFDTYTQVAGWSGERAYPENGELKFGASSAKGSLTSPSLDLSGTITVCFKGRSYESDDTKIKVYLNSAPTATQTIALGAANTDYFVTFTTGTASDKVTWEASAANKQRFYLDDITIYSGIVSSRQKSALPKLSGYPLNVGNVTSYAVTGLDGATEYNYSVCAVSGATTSLWSSIVSVTTTDGPAAPSFGVIPTQTGVVGDLIEFNVATYVSGSPSPTLTLLSSTADGGYLDDGGYVLFQPTNSGTFTFTFKASNTEGTAEGTVTVVVSDAPVYIPVVSASAITSSSFTADWTACTGATSYQIQVATDDQFTAGVGESGIIWSNAATSTTAPTGWLYNSIMAPSYIVLTNGNVQSSVFSTVGYTSLALNFQARTFGGTTGNQIVISVSTDGGSSWVEAATRRPADKNMTAMDEVDLSAYVGHSSVRVRWTAPETSGAATVGIQSLVLAGESSSDGGSVILDETTSALTYAVTDLEPATDYYVRVRMEDGTWSAILPVTTGGGVPTAPVFSSMSAQNGVERQEMSFRVSATGYPRPVLALDSSTASSGYSFNATTGVLTFTPGTEGSFNFVFSATNDSGSDTLTVTVNVSALSDNYYGLFVGITDSDWGIMNSDWTADATAMRDALVANGSWTLPNTTLLTDAGATETAIRAAVGTFAGTAAAGDTVVLYFATYADMNGEYNGEIGTPCDYYDDPYTTAEMAADLAAFADGVKIIIMLEADSGARFLNALLSESALQNKVASGELAWMSAADEGEYADDGGTDSDGDGYLDPPFNTVITPLWLDAFENGDSNGDGALTFLEMYQYSVDNSPYTDLNPQASNTALLDSVYASLVPEDSAPVFSTIPQQSTYIGAEFEFNAADYVSGRPVPTLTLLSSTADANDYDAQGGYIYFIPSAMGTFTFTFEASNTEGTAEGTVTVVVGAAPVYVPTVSASAITTSSFTADWTACTGATSYQIQVATDDQFTLGGSGEPTAIVAYDGVTSNGIPTGWQYSESYSGSYLPLTNASTYVRSAVFSSVGYTDLSIDFDSRTFGGTTGNHTPITVSISTDGGTTWTTLGTCTPTSSKLDENPQSLSASAYLNQSTLCVRWQALGAGAGKGAGIGNIFIMGSAPAGDGSILLDETVSVLSYDVAALDADTLYYVRVRMADGDWSTVLPVRTLSLGPSAPSFAAIPQQTGLVGDLIEIDVTPYVSGSPTPTVTLLNSTAGSDDYLEEDGVVIFGPTNSGTFTFTFEASNTEGTAEGTVTVVVSDPPLAMPVLNDASGIGSSSFTASWDAVPGAESYILDVVIGEQGSGGEPGATLLTHQFESSAVNAAIEYPDGWTGVRVYGTGTNMVRVGSDNTEKGWIATPPLANTAGSITVVYSAYYYASDMTVLKLGVSADGETYTEVDQSLTGTLTTYTQTFSNVSAASQVRWMCGPNDNKERFYLGDIAIYAGTAPVVGVKAAALEGEHVAGYPKNVGNVTSYTVTGLTPETEYTFSVVAVRGSETSEWAVAKTVTTLEGGSTPTAFESWMDGYTFSDGADLTADGDADGDGFTNGEEYTAGTDPSAISEFPQVEAVTTSALTIEGVSGRTYTAEWVSELVDVDWDETAEVLDSETAVADGPVELDIYKADTTAGFIRVIIEGPTP